MVDGDFCGECMLDVIDKVWCEVLLKVDLDGVEVCLFGFGVLLDGDNEYVCEFLLVLYFGVCIYLLLLLCN